MEERYASSRGNDGESTTASSTRLLYVDAACYVQYFFRRYNNQQWDLAATKRHVKAFCDAAAGSDLVPVVFVGYQQKDRAKWRRPREQQVIQGSRGIPPGNMRLLGDMFVQQGVAVHYCYGENAAAADNADTTDRATIIASHAQAVDNGVDILSKNRDLLCFTGTFTVHKDFDIQKGRLLLRPHKKIHRKEACSMRAFINPPPPTSAKWNPLCDCVTKGTYLRGDPCPLRHFEEGNLHLRIRPLRQALYHYWNIASVEEEFPILRASAIDQNECIIWEKQTVPADPSGMDYLQSPSQAVEHFTEDRPDGLSDQDWRKRQFALRALIADISCNYTGRIFLETLEDLLSSMDSIPRKRRTKRNKKPEKNIDTSQPQSREKPQSTVPETYENGISNAIIHNDTPTDDPETKNHNRRKQKRNRNRGQNKSKGKNQHSFTTTTPDSSSATNTLCDPPKTEYMADNDKQRWKPHVFSDDGTDIWESDGMQDARLVRWLLNKITPSNFDKVFTVFLAETKIHLSRDRMMDAIDTVVERAAMDSRYADVYANFCGRLVAEDLSMRTATTLDEEEPKANLARDTLLSICARDLHLPIERPSPEHRVDIQFEAARRRYIGSKRFVGELCNNGVLTINETMSFLETVLQQTQLTAPEATEVDELPLEALCVLLDTCGKTLDESSLAGPVEDMRRCWDVLRSFTGEGNNQGRCKASFRMKHMVLDLLELRDLNWRPVRYGARRRREMVAKPLLDVVEGLGEDVVGCYGGSRDQKGTKARSKKVHFGHGTT